MKAYQVICKRRSIRRFKQKVLTLKFLKKVVNAARLAPSGANLQPLEYICIDDRRLGDDIFKTLAWAGYISPRGTPAEGERPVAYILVLVNTLVRKDNYQYDVGAAMENMILTAGDEGVGACWIGSINRPELSKALNIPPAFVIDSILALGYPKENPKVEKLTDSCKYWKDANRRLHVPKRDIDSIMRVNKF
jgi:nitroreductase